LSPTRGRRYPQCTGASSGDDSCFFCGGLGGGDGGKRLMFFRRHGRTKQANDIQDRANTVVMRSQVTAAAAAAAAVAAATAAADCLCFPLSPPHSCLRESRLPSCRACDPQTKTAAAAAAAAAAASAAASAAARPVNSTRLPQISRSIGVYCNCHTCMQKRASGISQP